MTTYERCLNIWALVALTGLPVKAQSVLLRGSTSEPREIAGVNTYAGPVRAVLAPAEPNDQVLIVVLADTIGAGQRDHVRSEILSFYQDPANAGPAKKMLLGVLKGQELTQLGPFRSRAQLHAVLHKWWSEPETGLAPSQAPNAAILYSWLADSAGQLGSNWSSAVLIGSLPDVEAPLRDYAAAWLASRLAAQRVRTSYWNPEGPDPGWFTEVCQATGGLSYSAGLAPLSEVLHEAQPGLEVSWQPPTAVHGFLVYRAKLVTPTGAVAGEIPAIAVRNGVTLPDLTGYAELRQHVENARKLAAEAHPTQEQTSQIRAELEAAVRINASDPEALRLGADFYKRFDNYATAAQLLAILVETQPADAALLAELGHAQFAAQQFPEAEKVLLRARELGGGDSRVAEELGRLHVARHDDAGALPFIEESLGKEGGNQPLWFLRADVAARLKDWSRETASLERGIALGGDTLARRTSLVRLYLDHQVADKALEHIRIVTAALPKDATVGRTYAEFLDELHRSDDALSVWQKVLEVDPGFEPAHFRVTRLLIEKGNLPDALTGADAGLAAAPKSARLYVAKSEILEKRGAFYESRDVLRRAAVTLDEPALLARLSELEDISGRAAARSYLRLAEVLEKSATANAEYRRALERGLEVAWRDNDAEIAMKCANLLAVGQ
ncbi:MAG TPA: tetratricopeptide repeat protein, partial [Bryobacteraceae bacterium]|nr:tetratricopeptide repeat protein [Bryobacteraceae bacterium]